MSFKMKIVRFIVRKMSKGMFNADKMDVKLIRQKLEKAYANHKVEKGVTVKYETYNGVEVAVFTPDVTKSNNIVYYVHGGGLVTGDRHTAGPYSSQLALETGCKVVSCSYRLAPEDPFPAGFDDSYAVYKYLLENQPDSKISLIGESGGAYLSLVLALRARDEGVQCPSSVVINSIVADMSDFIKRSDVKTETTVTVGGMKQLAEMYAPDMDLTNPYISPIYADFTNLPPVRIVYDKGELLAIDSEKVAEKAQKAGVKIELEAYKGCFHAFTTLGKDSPESKRELKESSRFMLESFV
ncbi:alpha/beta hydrolase [Plebeiibacterium marinum]|uniref:Alpha/beta hydrolase n=1 Tax=Plebeiibacterium marinum TaxID=2992111 RepID=A0AAE3SKV6_9BACT|nr:alpha/beta hydrolase [Plebeiobacterium marinum]MCW3807037.1 alpha/beta hydrolase [Plebeiobacterium marinum]